MRSFFKIVFASMLGYFLAAFLVLFIVIWMIAGLASGFEKKHVEVAQNSILKISLNQPIQEREDDFNWSTDNWTDMDNAKSPGLRQILECIRYAKTDARIKGIYLDVPFFPSGYGTLGEIREALEDFKASGKFVYAYAESYSKGGYLLSSVADKVWLNPVGELLFNGMYSESIFFKKALEKMGVKMNIFRGRDNIYKSAVEPFMAEKMSEDAKIQTSRYLQLLYNDIIASISKDRKINPDSLKSIAENMLVRNAQDALDKKMVDALYYEDQVQLEIKKKAGVDPSDKIPFISLGKYSIAVAEAQEEEVEKDKIALVYAPGEITSGQGDPSQTGSEKMVESLQKARDDKRVKAVVLRVNSPGGSALASEIIWREVKLTAEKKPVVVSMGDVAASGGYYISAPATYIFAEPQTITGSIGIFAAFPDLTGLMNDKLGINSDGVKIGKYADLGKPDRPLTPDEQQMIQIEINKMYDLFLKRVADGRKLQPAQVHDIARGRVWLAQDAKDKKLVDEIGTLQNALAKAAQLAGLKKYNIIEFPKLEDPFARIMKLFGQEARTQFLTKEFMEMLPWLKTIQSMKNWHPVQARLPYEIVIH